jgi:hypothetical protein
MTYKKMRSRIRWRLHLTFTFPLALILLLPYDHLVKSILPFKQCLSGSSRALQCNESGCDATVRCKLPHGLVNCHPNSSPHGVHCNLGQKPPQSENFPPQAIACTAPTPGDRFGLTHLPVRTKPLYSMWTIDPPINKEVTQIYNRRVR